MKRSVLATVSGLLVSVLCAAPVWAQGTAQISGTVKDQSGAVLPGVEVTAMHVETGISRNTVTNETGSYVLPNLAVGPYRLEAALPGFRTYVQTGIVLQVGSSPVVNPVLGLGQVSEQVEVQANAAMVETRNSGVGHVIENQRILELPLNGRGVTELITLSGAAVQTGSTRNNNSGQVGGSPFISVGGGLGFGVAYSLDGANHLNFINGSTMPIPFPDALQEFKVETSGLGAQHGKETTVNSVTKSGTNEFHGNLFEFVRNDLFNARNYFATKGSTLKRNQFGGTFGGPMKQNKLFFFGAFQRTTIREDPADLRAFLPTASVLAGDWNAFTSAICNAGRTIALRAPFINNRIDPATYSRPALNILNRLNQIGPEPCGEVTYGRRNVTDENQIVGKVDYQWSPKQSIFGRYVATTLDIGVPAALNPGNLLNTTVTGQDNLAQSFALGDTYLFSANTVNAFRLSFNRVHAVVLGPEVFSACDVGVRMYCGGFEKSIDLAITGGFTVGARFIPRTNNNYDHWTGTNYQIGDDLSLVQGNHQFVFGGNVMQGRHVEKYLWFAIGLMSFTGQATNLGLADFMTGQLSQLTTAGVVHHSVNHNQVALYATDTWKAIPRLTLNYGLRWEPYLPQVMTNGRAYNFDHAKFQQGIKSTVFKNAPAGFTYTGDPGFPGKSGIDKRWAQFAPRIGLAWDVKGDGRTSIRASYAYGYDFVAALWREDYSSAAPWTNNTTITGVPFDDPWRGFPGGDPFPVSLGADARFSPYTMFQAVPQNMRTPSTSSWNLSVQKQIAEDWLVSASYIGTQATHIWAQQALTPATYIPGGPCTIQGVTYNPSCSTLANTNQRRRLSLERPQDGQLIGPLSIVDDGATQSYNGLLLNVQRRAARGVTVGTNYTLSHCIGDYADLTSQGPDANETYTVPNSRAADRGNCNTDRRHILNMTAVAETPTFGGPTLRAAVSGWRLSGIYRWSSGAPMTVIAGTDRALNGIFFQRADQVLPNPYGDTSGRPFTNWLNPAAFAPPAVGAIGNVGRNSVVAPGAWSFDLALSRAFRLSETHRLEARAEAYNVTNSFRPTLGTGNQAQFNQSLATNTFGQIRLSLDPRILQFALKYAF